MGAGGKQAPDAKSDGVQSMSITYIEDSEDTTADFQMSYADWPDEGLALVACALDSREEFSAGEPVRDSQVWIRSTHEQLQHSRVIYDMLPAWLR
jgi:hypothetical protein